MKIRYGLISADSHIVLDRDAFHRHMPSKWGSLIPQVREMEVNGQRCDRWFVHDEPAGGWGVVNCPAVMGDRDGDVKVFPQRWQDVPAKVYDPLERAEALDEDRVDGEVLFPNDPGRGMFYQWGAEFELACVQAHNDAEAEWYQASDRFAPLMILPYLSPIETLLNEVHRGAKNGHRGITMLGSPNRIARGVAHLADPFWEPFWQTCEELDLPLHFHESAGAAVRPMPRWDGHGPGAMHTVLTSPTAATVAQLIPNLVFSGILARHPNLKWVCAEAGVGWLPYVLEACDYEWERRHLWTEGITTRPSESIRSQVYVNFWYERSGIELRHEVGIDHIMWESDYPHTTSTYPRSWEFVERTLAGVPEEERTKMLYANAARVYHLD
ncbi:MAG TPA: amidohydrolase family protein [Chloroflexota bacterium]|nr:amidohydrolase family protein [Chloroflexota bacterium]